VSRGRRGNPELIGLFVLGAAVLAVGAVVVFGSGAFLRRQQQMVCYFSGSVNGLSQGAPVKFRGVPIGTVSDIRFYVPPADVSPAALRIPVWIEIDLSRLSELRGGPAEITLARLRELIEAGLRAQLQTESFVTGVLYVGLDYFPGTPVVLESPPDSGVFEIPTLPTTLEQVFQTLQRVMARLDHADIEGLIASAQKAMDGVGRLASSPAIEETLTSLRATLASVRGVTDALEPAVGPAVKGLDATSTQARASLVSLDRTLDRLHALLDPQAPLAVDLVRTLNDLGEAARSIRTLADYLDRNPNAVLTGRPGS
jgi:phospholipid/cholesterol/gamma-HCH transport system substrate-binding protein